MRLADTTERVQILGVDIDVVTISQAIETIINTAAHPQSSAAYVVKPYVEFLVRARIDGETREILNGAALSVADGIALIWAAAYLYAGPRTTWRLFTTLVQIIVAPQEIYWPLPERFGGITFAVPMLQAAANKGLRIALVGSPKAQSLQATEQAIQAFAPGANIVVTAPGRDASAPSGEVSDAWLHQLSDTLQSARPDLVLVGMGFPLQERVCAQLARSLPHGILVGEGGTFDFEPFGGQRAKAPVYMQQAGLEWLYRLVQEPSRWRRQLAIPVFIYQIWRSR